MVSEALRKVRRFEEENKNIDRAKRPAYHLTGIKGWINDPNGFSYYKDKVHLFYQAHPYELNHGPIHWGHAVTDDFVRWNYLPSALAPDKSYDLNGCFLGTAITTADGKHLLMYTGVDEKGKDHQRPSDDPGSAEQFMFSGLNHLPHFFGGR